MQRADILLHQRGLAPSRSVAQRLIAAGSVQHRGADDWTTIVKPGLKLDEDTALRITDESEIRYVSRGGLKLEGALAQAGLDVPGFVALDVGQSTGGFSDCLLQHGAARVVGIDSGHDQLAPALRGNERIVALEGINARHPACDRLRQHVPAAGFDIIVMDLSFISQTLVVPKLAELLRSQGKIVALVKPQFEVGPENVGKGGIVRDASTYIELRQAIEQCYRECGLEPQLWFDSPITGGDGNREFFIVARNSATTATR